MFLVDLQQGRIVDDEELKHQIASAKPYGKWLREYMVPLADLPPAPDIPGPDPETLLQRQQAFGYTLEDLKYILGPMGDQRRGGDRLDGQRHARWRCSPTVPSRCSITSSSSSPR